MESRQASNSYDFKIKISQMALQVLESLQRLHSVGFCHWDIKLDNICFNEGRYYLIDFAFA